MDEFVQTCIDGWMDLCEPALRDGWMHACMEERMNKQVFYFVSACVGILID